MDLLRQEIKNPVGILLDPNPSDLPPNSWSFGQNIRFKNGKTIKAQGHSIAFEQMPPGNTTSYLLPYLTDNIPYWFAGTHTGIYRTEGFNWREATRRDNTGTSDNPVWVTRPYTASDVHRWNGGFLSGVAIMNNGSDVPQALISGDNYFQDLPNWDPAYRAKIVRPFKNYLVALNILRESQVMNTVVKWSSPADPGNVPYTWDITDPTNDAGETPLADTAGAIVDGKKLRDSFIIYKEDSVYSMRYVGGVYVFQFQQLFDDVGMLAPNCAAEFDGKHFVVGQGDVYVHNGVQKSSIIDGKIRKYLFDSIKAGAANNSVFVVPDYNACEMWICFQNTTEAANAEFMDRAAIWNWQENTWTFRELPRVISAAVGIVDPREPDEWNQDPAAWETDATVWGSASYNPAKTRLIFTSKIDNKIYAVGDTTLFDTEGFTSRVDRTDFFDGNDQSVKHITTITPHLRGTGLCNVFVGHSMIADSPVEWEGPYSFQIGTDYKIDCRVSGRFYGVRFEFPSQSLWELTGYTIEQTPPVGKR